MSRASLAETSVAGTPALQSPVVDGARRAASPTAIQIPSEGEVHGLGLGLTERERRESITSTKGGAAESVTSGKAAGEAAESVKSEAGMMASPGGSVVSSPRMAHATLEAVRGGLGKPALPTAKSWADVARRETRKVNIR